MCRLVHHCLSKRIYALKILFAVNQGSHGTSSTEYEVGVAIAAIAVYIIRKNTISPPESPLCILLKLDWNTII